MAKSKKTSVFSRFSNQQLLVAAVFVVGFGSFGVYKLGFSNAAPRPRVVRPVFTITTDATTAVANNPSLPVVQDNVFYVGSKSVIRLTSGLTADFSPQKGGGDPTPLRDCYYVRATESAAKVTITNGSNQQTFDVPYNLNGYQQICLGWGSGSFLGFNIKHVGGGAVNVHQKVYEYNEAGF